MSSPAPLVQPARVSSMQSEARSVTLHFGREEVGEVSIDGSARASPTSCGLCATGSNTAADGDSRRRYPERAERFEVVYHLLSVTRNHRLRIRVPPMRSGRLPTVTNVYPVAGWLEREVFDMYGVVFEGNRTCGHPHRYGFRGHPHARISADRLCRAALFRGRKARRL